MKKYFEIILKIIGVLLGVGLLALAVLLSAGALLIVLSTFIVLAGAITIPAVVKTAYERRKMKKAFKQSCKEEGIRPNMSAYREAIKEEFPFQAQAVIAAAEIFGKKSEKAEEIAELKEFRKEAMRILNSEQLEAQAELQKTVYGFTFNGKDYYTDTESNRELYVQQILEHYGRSILLGRQISSQELSPEDFCRFRIYYMGEHLGKTNVVRKESRYDTEYFTIDDVPEFYIEDLKSWAIEISDADNIDELRYVYRRKGLTGFKQKEKKKNYK